jgi:hypothetical protein
VAELVDAKDLKSFVPRNGTCRFNSGPRHRSKSNIKRKKSKMDPFFGFSYLILSWALSSVGSERYLDTVEVSGSNPLGPTDGNSKPATYPSG